MIHIDNQDGKYVASIVQQHKSASSYRPEETWLLLYNTGRTDCFHLRSEAIAEAKKTWPRAIFYKGSKA